MSVLEDIFIKIMKSKIFKNRDLLKPDYIPEKLPHREKEIIKLGSLLAPALKGDRPNNVFIYGLTGTGKTAVTKYVAKKLEESAKKFNAKVKFSYINCRQNDTPYRILVELCESICVKVPFTGIPTAEVWRRFVRGLESLGVQMIVILDELDCLVKKHGDDILYRLTRANENLRESQISLIGITNDLRLNDLLDPRIKSSLGEVEVVFPPYNAVQLEDILSERARKAFYEGALDEGVISLCSALAAREHGDARKALDLLRVAGELAEQEGAEKVTLNHVWRARDELEKDKVSEIVRTMPLHGKLILLSILKFEKRREKLPTSGEIYSTYKSLCYALDIAPLTSRRISDIVNELDMLGLITAKIVNRGRYGRTKVVKLNVQHRFLEDIIAEEPRLREALRKR